MSPINICSAGYFPWHRKRHGLTHGYPEFSLLFKPSRDKIFLPDCVSAEWMISIKMPQGCSGNCFICRGVVSRAVVSVTKKKNTDRRFGRWAVHLISRSDWFSSDIIVRWSGVCSAWPVCVLEHDKMGLYLWSYLFLQLYSSSRADAAFHPRGLMIITEKGIRPVGVS